MHYQSALEQIFLLYMPELHFIIYLCYLKCTSITKVWYNWFILYYLLIMQKLLLVFCFTVVNTNVSKCIMEVNGVQVEPINAILISTFSFNSTCIYQNHSKPTQEHHWANHHAIIPWYKCNTGDHSIEHGQQLPSFYFSASKLRHMIVWQILIANYVIL